MKTWHSSGLPKTTQRLKRGLCAYLSLGLPILPFSQLPTPTNKRVALWGHDKRESQRVKRSVHSVWAFGSSTWVLKVSQRPAHRKMRLLSLPAAPAEPAAPPGCHPPPASAASRWTAWPPRRGPGQTQGAKRSTPGIGSVDSKVVG